MASLFQIDTLLKMQTRFLQLHEDYRGFCHVVSRLHLIHLVFYHHLHEEKEHACRTISLSRQTI
jgi:hypothetical protein